MEILIRKPIFTNERRLHLWEWYIFCFIPTSLSLLDNYVDKYIRISIFRKGQQQSEFHFVMIQIRSDVTTRIDLVSNQLKLNLQSFNYS